MSTKHYEVGVSEIISMDMDNQGARDRTALTVVAETDLSSRPEFSSLSSRFHSAAILTRSHTQVLLYLGTGDGKIVLLSWNPSNLSPMPSPAKANGVGSSNSLNTSDDIFLLASKTLGRHAIEAICTLQESNKVVVLANSFIFLFDVYLMESVNQLIFTKGASAMAKRMLSPNIKISDERVSGFDLADGLPSGGVLGSESRSGLQRRFSGEPSSWSKGQGFVQKIGAFGWTSRKSLLAPELAKEGNGSAGNKRVRNAQWAVAVGKRLFLCEILSTDRYNKMKEVVRNKQSSMVMNEFGLSGDMKVKELPGVEGVLTMAWLDNSIIVGTVNGYTVISITDGNSTPVFSLPDSSSPPLLKCIPRDGEVLLLVDNVGIVVNGAGQPTAGSLLFKHYPDSVGQSGSYVVVVKQGKLELYHKATGFRVQSISLATTGHSIVADENQGNFVIVATESKVSCLQQVSIEEQLKELLRKKNYDEAVYLAEECIKKGEGEHAKEMLAYVHAQAGFLLLFDLQFQIAVDHFLQSEVMQPSEIFPFIMPDPNRWSPLVPRNRYWGLHPPPRPLEEVVENGLSTIQREALLKKAGVATGPFTVGGTMLPSSSSRSILLELAIQNIIRYLKASRNKNLAPLMKEGVDTLLMYLYRVLSLTEEMEQLASSENSCVVEELEALLEESGHLRTLAFLYASKGLQQRALNIWRIIAQRNLTIPLQGSSVMWKRGRESTGLTHDQLAAAVEAARLLEESSDHKLVLEHLTWIIEMDQDLVVKVLTSSKRSSPLPPDEVFSAVDPNAIDVHQRYLQWLIEDQGSEDVRFHTLYALLLAKAAIDGTESISEGVASREEAAEINAGYVLNDENKFSNDCGHIDKEVQEIDEQIDKQLVCRSIRERLQSFLLSSDKYDAEAVLELIKDSELWPEQAILYRKLGEETLVLQILALKLEDSEAAEQYCAELGRPDAYMQLLDMYLEPGHGKEPMYKAAVRLLHCHGESLDPLQVLEALSPDMPLQLASETLSRMLRARVHHLRQGQIVQSLSRAVNLDARLSRFEERSRQVQINDESLCDSCHSRLGTKLFAMYPNDSVVCYKCFKRYGEHICPVTGRDFEKDAMFKPSWLVRLSEKSSGI